MASCCILWQGSSANLIKIDGCRFKGRLHFIHPSIHQVQSIHLHRYFRSHGRPVVSTFLSIFIFFKGSIHLFFSSQILLIILQGDVENKIVLCMRLAIDFIIFGGRRNLFVNMSIRRAVNLKT